MRALGRQLHFIPQRRDKFCAMSLRDFAKQGATHCPLLRKPGVREHAGSGYPHPSLRQPGVREHAGPGYPHPSLRKPGVREHAGPGYPESPPSLRGSGCIMAIALSTLCFATRNNTEELLTTNATIVAAPYWSFSGWMSLCSFHLLLRQTRINSEELLPTNATIVAAP